MNVHIFKRYSCGICICIMYNYILLFYLFFYFTALLRVLVSIKICTKITFERQIKLTHLITHNFVIDTNYVNQLVCIAHVRAVQSYNSVNSNEGK